MVKKIYKTPTEYIRSQRGGVSWNTVYKKFKPKAVNRAISRGSIYSGMRGEALAITSQ